MTGHNFFKDCCANRILLWYNLPPFFFFFWPDLAEMEAGSGASLNFGIAAIQLESQESNNRQWPSKESWPRSDSENLKSQKPRDNTFDHTRHHCWIYSFISVVFEVLKRFAWGLTDSKTRKSAWHRSLILQQNMAEGVKSKRLAGCCKMETEW